MLVQSLLTLRMTELSGRNMSILMRVFLNDCDDGFELANSRRATPRNRGISQKPLAPTLSILDVLVETDSKTLRRHIRLRSVLCTYFRTGLLPKLDQVL